MTLRMLTMILASVGMSAAAQVLFKIGMRPSSARDASTSAADSLYAVASALTNVTVLSGFALYGASALLWLLVLRSTDLSVAYPFVGLGFALTMLAGWALLGESINTVRIVGTLLVCAGVACLAISTRE